MRNTLRRNWGHYPCVTSLTKQRRSTIERLKLAADLLDVVSEVKSRMYEAGWAQQIDTCEECIKVGELEIGAESLIENLYDLAIPVSQKAYDTPKIALQQPTPILTEGERYHQLLAALLRRE